MEMGRGCASFCFILCSVSPVPECARMRGRDMMCKGEPMKIFEVLKVGIPDTPMAMFSFTDEQRWALVYRVMEFSRRE